MAEKQQEIPYVYYRYIHSKIFKNKQGRPVKRKDLWIYLHSFKIPKKLRPLIIKELEILGLIKKNQNEYEIEQPTIYEENINEYYDCLGMFDCGDEDYSLNNE